MRTSNNIIFLSTLVCLISLVSCSEARDVTKKNVSNSISGLELRSFGIDLEPSSVKLDTLMGAKLFVFWATWCGVCIEEKPTLARLKKDIDISEFSLVEINMDKNPIKALKKFKEKKGLENIQYLPSKALFEAVGNVELLPTIILVDKKGNVRNSWLGKTSYEDLWGAIQIVNQL
jgi:thiol-disulfide isomerase/thioredoxin